VNKISATALALGIATLVACGTRLPAQSFAPRVEGAGQTVQGDGSAAPRSAMAPAGPSAPMAPGVAAVGAVDSPVNLRPGVASSAPGSSALLSASTVASGTRRTLHRGAPGAATPTTTAAPAAAAAKGVNWASDRGVTATSITIANLVSAGGIFGSEQFGVSKFGAQAYFADLNVRGGINGRQVRLLAYNDNGQGSEDVSQTKQAIDVDKVFAFVANNIFQYDGADHVQETATPDIGGQPIKAIYYKYSHLFSLLGNNDPRDNTQMGFHGFEYGTSEIGQFFKQKVGSTNVGVVYYDQSGESHRGAAVVGESFRRAGLPVTLYPVNVGLPNFANTVAQMQSDGVDTVADAMDSNGNAKLCQAMESNSFINQVKAKVSTIGSWSQRLPTELKQTPQCRDLTYVTGSSRNYADVSNPGVAAFRAAMHKYFPTREALMAQWSYEGWIAGQIFTEAAASCGANLTRTCVEAYLVKPGRVFTAGGNTTGFSWDPRPESAFADQSRNACTSVARWSNAAGTFLTIGDLSTSCFTTPYYKYEVS
jgi:branched-chain amino acid transport system substrate-binding protein